MNTLDHININIPPNQSWLRRWFWPAVAVVLMAGAGALLLNFVQPPTAAAAVSEPPSAPTTRLLRMEVVTIAPQLKEELVKVNGTIHPIQEVAIAAQVGGLAESVSVQPGDSVIAGQLLVEVGTSDLELQLAQQRSTMASTTVQLRAAEATLERTTLLAQRGLSATTALDSAQAQLDQLNATLATQQLQVAQAEANLRRARVVAPFDGTIASRALQPGQVINAGTTMLSVVDLSAMRVELVAPLSRAAMIAPGQTVRLNVQGVQGAPMIGTVERVSPSAEAGTRSIKVYLTLENAEGVMRGGMFVSGSIVVRAQADVIAVPAAAISTRSDASFVKVVANGVIEDRTVVTGAAWDNAAAVEVRSGLKAGEVIVGTPMSGLNDGAAVMIEGN